MAKAGDFFQRLKPGRKAASPLDVLRTSPLFDPAWYRETHEDLRGKPIDAAKHYLEHGTAEGRNPSPLFDTKWYLQQNPDVAVSGMNPLVHYISSGQKEGRTPYARNSNFANTLNGSDAKIETAQLAEIRPTNTAHPSSKDYRFVRDVHYEVWQAPESLKDKNVCLFAAYAPDGYIFESTLMYVGALRRQKYTVIVIAASRNSGRPYADTEIICDGLISRDNFGYDFACWALGMQILPSIWQAKSVIFTNDSILGPLSQQNLATLIERIKASQVDCIALTQSWQVKHHFQSYFFVLKAKALAHPRIQSFWTSLEVVGDRDQAILRYEVPMLEMIRSFGLPFEIVFDLGGRDTGQDVNPTLDHWRELIDSGFPFVKVQILRDDITGVDKSNWEQAIRADPDIRSAIMARMTSDAEKARKSVVARSNK